MGIFPEQNCFITIDRSGVRVRLSNGKTQTFKPEEINRITVDPEGPIVTVFTLRGANRYKVKQSCESVSRMIEGSKPPEEQTPLTGYGEETAPQSDSGIQKDETGYENSPDAHTEETESENTSQVPRDESGYGAVPETTTTYTELDKLIQATNDSSGTETNASGSDYSTTMTTEQIQQVRKVFGIGILIFFIFMTMMFVVPVILMIIVSLLAGK